MSFTRNRLVAVIALLGIAGVLTGGCAAKDQSATPATTTTAPAAGAAVPGEAKLTPEQEAIKQKAIQQGPAIEAAMAAGPNNPTGK